ncbi:GlxA family transcriptional regulator [Aliamphritea hakodatensis]|uniref:GlxA family transcriptional regulator n=1 Tax=Aliamphritea hakodatensis TaxID=2895352 RepID=UPI0022FD3D42|nr:GlxA family transcriptional regulator [Aliamphritea hakodatensis]
MILKPDHDGIFTISFLLLPEYAMVGLLSAIEPLRVANRFAGREIFRWQLLSDDGESVNACNQLAIQQTQSIQDVETPKNLFVCASFNPEKYINETTLSWLKKLYRKGSVLGAMDTGCYVLAAANLLRNQRFTLHWEAVPAFQEDNPGVEISNELFEIDKNLITCAGGTAAIDMMLHIIQAEFGHDLAINVCEQFIQSGIRQKSAKQRIGLAARLKIHHPRLLKVLAKMEANIENPLSPSELAEHAHLSVRQLERLFRSHLDKSPTGYYMQIRLERAQQLLRESHLSVAEIGIACGFSSAPHFTRSYRNQFQLSPSEDR